MKAVYSPFHTAHVPGVVIENGVPRQSRDVPQRVDALLRACRKTGWEIVDAVDWGLRPLSAVHSTTYLDFLATSYSNWRERGLPGDVSPATFETRSNAYRDDWSVVAKAGFHLRDQITPVGEGTWLAAYWAAQVAVTAADLIVGGAREAYALCRPSGHHAGRDFGGGATYLNNAAIAARRIAAIGARVAILDLDVHHGNGTQSVFWDDSATFFTSLHRCPTGYYPHFTGFVDETGGPNALNANLNVTLAPNAGDQEYLGAVRQCLEAARRRHATDVMVVSLGFDALDSDPAKGLLVSASAFRNVGELLGALRVPILLVQEGGYDVERLEDAASNFLKGFR
jgi:acetoin utilization deacetylase AcuC-like enzyme